MTQDFKTYLGRAEVFDADGEPVTARELAEMERALGVTLPASYKQFLKTLGPGYWCGNHIPPPDELFAFDEDCGTMSGFVTLVQGVADVGDHIALNPRDEEVDGERPVYYCSHDLLAYARAADSFEEWVRDVAAADQAGEDYFGRFDGVMTEALPAGSAPREETARKWWQFWR
jgi:hypothetical protein